MLRIDPLRKGPVARALDSDRLPPKENRDSSSSLSAKLLEQSIKSYSGTVDQILKSSETIRLDAVNAQVIPWIKGMLEEPNLTRTQLNEVDGILNKVGNAIVHTASDVTVQALANLKIDAVLKRFAICEVAVALTDDHFSRTPQPNLKELSDIVEALKSCFNDLSVYFEKITNKRTGWMTDSRFGNDIELFQADLCAWREDLDSFVKGLDTKFEQVKTQRMTVESFQRAEALPTSDDSSPRTPVSGRQVVHTGPETDSPWIPGGVTTTHFVQEQLELRKLADKSRGIQAQFEAEEQPRQRNIGGVRSSIHSDEGTTRGVKRGTDVQVILKRAQDTVAKARASAMHTDELLQRTGEVHLPNTPAERPDLATDLSLAQALDMAPKSLLHAPKKSTYGHSSTPPGSPVSFDSLSLSPIEKDRADSAAVSSNSSTEDVSAPVKRLEFASPTPVSAPVEVHSFVKDVSASMLSFLGHEAVAKKADQRFESQPGFSENPAHHYRVGKILDGLGAVIAQGIFIRLSSDKNHYYLICGQQFDKGDPTSVNKLKDSKMSADSVVKMMDSGSKAPLRTLMTTLNGPNAAGMVKRIDSSEAFYTPKKQDPKPQPIAKPALTGDSPKKMKAPSESLVAARKVSSSSSDKENRVSQLEFKTAVRTVTVQLDCDTLSQGLTADMIQPLQKERQRDIQAVDKPAIFNSVFGAEFQLADPKLLAFEMQSRDKVKVGKLKIQLNTQYTLEGAFEISYKGGVWHIDAVQAATISSHGKDIADVVNASCDPLLRQNRIMKSKPARELPLYNAVGKSSPLTDQLRRSVAEKPKASRLNPAPSIPAQPAIPTRQKTGEPLTRQESSVEKFINRLRQKK